MKAQNIKIATVYSNTLFKEARYRKKIEKVYSDVQRMSEKLTSNDFFCRFWNDRIIKAHYKLDILTKIEKHLELDDFTVMFLRFLIKKRRESFLNEILEIFQNSYLESKGITKVSITSVNELSKSVLTSIKNKIKTLFNIKDPLISFKLDETLIGGITVEFMGKMLDLSIKTQLSKVHKHLLS